MIRIQAVTKGGLHNGSVYLKDGVGVTAKWNLELLDAIVHTLDSTKWPWVIGGDWNCEPDDLIPMHMVPLSRARGKQTATGVKLQVRNWLLDL